MDRWWALLGFPLALGFSFQWGFSAGSCRASVPARAPVDLRMRGGRRRAGDVGVAPRERRCSSRTAPSCGCSSRSPPRRCRGARPRRRALTALLPLLVPLGLAVPWRLPSPAEPELGVLLTPGPGRSSGFDRSNRCPCRRAPTSNRWPPGSAARRWRCSLAAGLRPSRERRRWLPSPLPRPPCVPALGRGGQRLPLSTVCRLPDPAGAARFRRWPRRVSARWLQARPSRWCWRDRPQRHVVPQLQCRGARLQRHRGGRGPHRRASLPRIDAGAKGFVTSPFLHFSAYIQAEKGGTINFSFAQAPVAVMQYRPGRALPHALPVARAAEPVRLAPRRRPRPLPGPHERARPARSVSGRCALRLAHAHAGRWWLFRKESSAPAANSRRVGPAVLACPTSASLVAPRTVPSPSAS